MGSIYLAKDPEGVVIDGIKLDALVTGLTTRASAN